MSKEKGFICGVCKKSSLIHDGIYECMPPQGTVSVVDGKECEKCYTISGSLHPSDCKCVCHRQAELPRCPVKERHTCSGHCSPVSQDTVSEEKKCEHDNYSVCINCLCKNCNTYPCIIGCSKDTVSEEKKCYEKCLKCPDYAEHIFCHNKSCSCHSKIEQKECKENCLCKTSHMCGTECEKTHHIKVEQEECEDYGDVRTCPKCKRQSNTVKLDEHCPFCVEQKPQVTCLNINCPERTGGQCNVLERNNTIEKFRKQNNIQEDKPKFFITDTLTEQTAYEYLRVDLKIPEWQARLIAGKIGICAENEFSSHQATIIKELESQMKEEDWETRQGISVAISVVKGEKK